MDGWPKVRGTGVDWFRTGGGGIDWVTVEERGSLLLSEVIEVSKGVVRLGGE